ncbi:hypothetical protein RO3G_03298 [Rhizopus delemar RA 99-880]|uniref:Uncharacterized protein n=1 Tax=Rhizopus delemar (strain RA 99-880 / ATCC MYA-4621 / FGSC 9543 / NRRL 43880) TaxID=246409 RepID=I1BQW4_RHIO9|nr:hypothetical protein RO3G_03298 [Rhizopus delemar RA 99-880]|eukprot:EIE78594.1 hypothetical protein RO3G_03298 [Rhizopus delemar RA 99-880]
MTPGYGEHFAGLGTTTYFVARNIIHLITGMEEKLISDIIRLHDISFTEDVLWDTVLNAIPKKFKGTTNLLGHQAGVLPGTRSFLLEAL